jgi:hypothetical protein
MSSPWRCCDATCDRLQRLLVVVVVFVFVPVPVFFVVGRIADRRLIVFVVVIVARAREAADDRTLRRARRKVAKRCGAGGHCGGMRRFWPG